MIGFGTVTKYVALFALLSGVLIGLASNALLIMQHPTNKTSYITAGKNIGKMIFASQHDVKKSVKGLKNVTEGNIERSSQYSHFLLWRILGSSMITLGIIYILYKGISFFVPASGGDLGARLLVLFISIGLVWGASLIYSLYTGKGWVMPFEGWVYLVRNGGVIREALGNAGYYTGLNSTLNGSVS